MASIEPRAAGTYRVRVRRNGAPTLTRTFDRREDAVIWGEETEAAVKAGTLTTHKLRTTTLGELLTNYQQAVTPRKKGRRQEHARIDALLRDPISRFSLENLTRPVLRAYRDRRLKLVSPSTMNRELALLSVVLKHAQAELDAPVDPSMLDGLRQSENPARTRRLEPGEYERLLAASPAWLRDYVVLAVESCMRRSELTALEWSRVDLQRRTATLLTAKNGNGRRIPLSGTALRVLEQMPRPIHGGRVFDCHVDTVTTSFIAACKAAGISGLRLHDLRAEGVSRLFEKGLDINSVKSISGHRSMIFVRYMREGDAETLAQRLA